MTSCVTQGQEQVWGPCSGEILPVTDATGKAACTCFSSGHWDIANLSPCFYTGNGTAGAISTLSSTGMCPITFDSAPTQSWSTDTLQADCTGSFKLCFTLKAGNPQNPMPTDCVVMQVCSSGYYGAANQVQMWPDLPGWLAAPSASACVQQFTNTGGYGQTSVDGQSDECDLVDMVLPETVTYCPLTCAQPNPPAMCAQCMAGGGGSF